MRNFAARERHLRDSGYTETVPEGDPKQPLFRRGGPTPYQQVYLLAPHFHQIELNAGPAPEGRS